MGGLNISPEDIIWVDASAQIWDKPSMGMGDADALYVLGQRQGAVGGVELRRKRTEMHGEKQEMHSKHRHRSVKIHS